MGGLYSARPVSADDVPTPPNGLSTLFLDADNNNAPSVKNSDGEVVLAGSGGGGGGLELSDVTGLINDATASLNAEVASLQAQIDAETSVYYHEANSDSPLITAPNNVVLGEDASGSFVADAEDVTVDIAITGTYAERLAGTAGLAFYYADAAVVSPPLFSIQQHAQRPGVNVVSLGGITGSTTCVASVQLTGLTVGHTYNWEITAAIIGYATGLITPDSPTGRCGASDAWPLSNDEVGTFQRQQGDIFFAWRSATKLHIARINHLIGLTDERLTGAGIDLTASSGNGGAYPSPDGKLLLVTHLNIARATLYDISNPLIPTKVTGADLVVGTAPFAAVWEPDSSAVWISGYGNNPGYVQKISAAGVVSSAVNLTGSGATAIIQLSITPDGNHIVLGDGAGKVWKVNTNTNVATGHNVPSGVAYLTCAISNTKAMTLHGASNILTEWTIATGAFDGAGLTGTFSNPAALRRFDDGHAVLLIRTSSPHIKHVLTRLGNGGEAAPNQYVDWPAVGTGVDADIDNKGNIYVVVAGGGVALPPDSGTYGVYLWYGGDFTMRAGSDFWGEKLTVRASPAH